MLQIFLLARVERAGGRERRQLRREAEAAAVQEAHRRAAFEKLAEVERDRLSRELPEARTEASELKGRHDAAHRFARAHPEASDRLAHLDRQVADAAFGLDIARQALDGIAPQVFGFTSLTALRLALSAYWISGSIYDGSP